MLVHGNIVTLGLLLLLHVSSALKFNLFRRVIESNPVQQEGDVRLFGGTVSEGRVEVYHDGKWGTVCDDGWDMAEAQVVCRQLRFPGAKSVVIGRNYGTVSGPIWLDELTCKGTEKLLVTCAFKSWGETDCSHKEDVGVICETGSTNMTISDSIHSVDHSISLSDDLGQIFDSGSGCDFLILVQSPTGNRQEDRTLEMHETTICAHKMILSQYPLFNASEGITNITVNIRRSCQPHFTTFIRHQVAQTCGKATRQKCSTMEKSGNICRSGQKTDSRSPNMMSGSETATADTVLSPSLPLSWFSSLFIISSNHQTHHALTVISPFQARINTGGHKTQNSRDPQFPEVVLQC